MIEMIRRTTTEKTTHNFIETGIQLIEELLKLIPPFPTFAGDRVAVSVPKENCGPRWPFSPVLPLF